MRMQTTIAPEKAVRVPEWVYYMTDEQFFQWCKQRKVHIGSGVRAFPDDERAAIFRYMSRNELTN